MDIASIIKDRILSLGISQADLAKRIHTTPSQLTLFFRGDASLTIKSLNECLEELNIDLAIYKRRNDLAKRIAMALKEKGYSNISNISHLSKQNIIDLTGEKSLHLFREVEIKEYKEIIRSGVIDTESTYNYIKGLIAFYLAVPDVKKVTKKQYENAAKRLLKIYNEDDVEYTDIGYADVEYTDVDGEDYVNDDMYDEYVDQNDYDDESNASMLKKVVKSTTPWTIAGVACAAIGVFSLIDRILFGEDD